ncbi:MAG TPA: transketolase, partial [Chloroflexi bacterium]|nr:transketolase [Chloroflexota bacterium]
MSKIPVIPEYLLLPLSKEEIIADYRLAYQSRQASMIGRREVLTGKAMFGIFGDGKEVAQLAIARAFQKGDWRSGYYRDQTWMFALGVIGIRDWLANPLPNADEEAEPAGASRMTTGHYASRFINPDGTWKNQMEMYNVSADVSPTGSQMPRLVGLAYASRLYRELPELQQFTQFSNEGQEIAWGTIGNASTAEGMFWEAVNAIGVLKAPAVITIYDDGYGISVPNQFQMVKENISAILSGFQRDTTPEDACPHGYDIYSVPAWNYPALLETYWAAAETAREYHIPALVHVTQVTQPLGHSTSGSHERYKSAERLKWEEKFDCITLMRNWMLANGIASETEISQWEEKDRQYVEAERKAAWEAFTGPILSERAELLTILDELAQNLPQSPEINRTRQKLAALHQPVRRDLAITIHAVLMATRKFPSPVRQKLLDWKQVQETAQVDRYNSQLHSDTPKAALTVPEVKPVYSENSPTVMAFEVLNTCFDVALGRDPRVVAFGEDV